MPPNYFDRRTKLVVALDAAASDRQGRLRRRRFRLIMRVPIDRQVIEEVTGQAPYFGTTAAHKKARDLARVRASRHFGLRRPRTDWAEGLLACGAPSRYAEDDWRRNSTTYLRMAEPTPEPFATGWLDVGDGHVLYHEQVGVRHGIPVLYLHGGPGSGCTPGARRNFDARRHRGVLFDQRAAGRSTPAASDDDVHWASIDMDHHIGDIEQLREHLGIDQWIVFGFSWGSVLGATYAERHPERVRALVLAAVSTGRAEDIDWLTLHAGRFFPEEWRQFRDHVPHELRHQRLAEAYNTLLMHSDPVVHHAAAAAWCRWEDAHVATTPNAQPNPLSGDPSFRLGFARQVTHCWRNNSWLAEDEIVRNVSRLAGIKGFLIHGRLDVSSPLDAAWRIHRGWPDSELIIVDEEGHGGEVMAMHWRRALAELAQQ